MARPYTPRSIPARLDDDDDDGLRQRADHRRSSLFGLPGWAVFGLVVMVAAGPAATSSLTNLLAPMFGKTTTAPNKGNKTSTAKAGASNSQKQAERTTAAAGPTTRDVKPGAGPNPATDKVAAAIAATDPITTSATMLTVPKTLLVSFAASAFPYQGAIPDATPRPFLNVQQGDRRGHSSVRGGVYWEDKTYSDRRTLLSLPAGFDLRKPAVMVVYFHGNQATLDRDVAQRQQVPKQVAESGLNAVLVAPQLAVDAQDSSAGHFWEPGFFSRFLDEAADKLAQAYGSAATKATFAKLPVIIVAYSGGYLPAAWSLKSGGAATARVRGVILLDALNGETDKFADWITNHRQAFFVSSFSKSTASQNSGLETILRQRKVAFETSLPESLKPGVTGFVDSGPDAVHQDFVTRAWVADPLKVVLGKIGGFPRNAPQKAPPAPAAATVAKR